MARSDGSWILPAPPRPELNFELLLGNSLPKWEAGPRAVSPSVVLGALKVFPTPPLPEWMYLVVVGCGSVT